jgi:hypothetical protein
MSTLPPDVQERLLAFGTLPGKFIPPARRLGEGWNPPPYTTPQTVTGYRKASAHTIARRTLYRRRRPPPSLSKPFRASSYRRRRSLFAEAIEPPVNVFSDWSRPRALCMVEKGAPPAQAGRILVPVQAPSTGRSGGTSVAEMRAAARRSSRPEDPLDEGRDCSRARCPPAASRAGDAVRSCPTALRSPDSSDWARARLPSVVPQRSKTYTG